MILSQTCSNAQDHELAKDRAEGNVCFMPGRSAFAESSEAAYAAQRLGLVTLALATERVLFIVFVVRLVLSLLRVKVCHRARHSTPKANNVTYTRFALIRDVESCPTARPRRTGTQSRSHTQGAQLLRRPLRMGKPALQACYSQAGAG